MKADLDHTPQPAFPHAERKRADYDTPQNSDS